MEAKAKIQSILSALSKEELIQLAYMALAKVQGLEEVDGQGREIFTDEYKAFLDKRVNEIEKGKIKVIPIQSVKNYMERLRQKVENE